MSQPPEPPALPRPIQRVGHIGDDDNRFCGAAVFAELADRIVEPGELVALGFGLPPLSADDREVLRCLALSLVSPDVRVWPLKLTRTLAAYGSPYAGYFGAQLGNHSDRMGPGTTSAAAASVTWLLARVGAEPSPAELAAAVAEHLATRGRISGFGVPLRPYDERLIGLTRLLAGHPATTRPAWRLYIRLADTVRAAEQLEPNIVIAMAALLVDLGLAPHRAGMFVSLLMAPTFAAHAVEAADHDGPYLRELPRAAIDDRSPPLRRTPAAAAEDAVAAQPPPTGATGFGPRRSLAW